MQNTRSFHFVFLLFSLAVALSSAIAQVVIATVPVGQNPGSIAVNPVTNKIYVNNAFGPSFGAVTVIDGASNSTATVNVGVYPYYLDLDSVTNKIYVTNLCGNDVTCNSAGTVTVIDGVGNNTTTVNVGVRPFGVAVNPVTNKIYVANQCGNDLTCNSAGTVTVIDGATNNTVTVSVGVSPNAIAVDKMTNKIYVGNVGCINSSPCPNPGTVTVIDGATNSTITVSVGVNPYSVAADEATNKIYVVNHCGNGNGYCGSGTVTVIDGATNSTTTVSVGQEPYWVAVDAVINKIYVTNLCGNDPQCSGVGTLTVIDGATNNTTSVNVGFYPFGVAVDSVTNKIYVANTCTSCDIRSGTVTVIDGVTNNTVPVAVVGDGAESVAVNATTDRIYVTNDADVVSIIAGDTALQFVPVTPCRLVDTRNPNGEFGGPPIQSHTSRSFTIPDNQSCNVPSIALAYSLNVTLVPIQNEWVGYLTLFPTGDLTPLASTMNSWDGRIKANAAIVQAGTSGAVSVFVNSTTNVVLDINGYFTLASDSTLAFYPLAPCRVADTRDPNDQGLGAPSLSGGVPRNFPILKSNCAIPSSALAYSLNFTAVPHVPLDYLTVWPAGQPQPGLPTLNGPTSTIAANAAIVPAGTGGDIEVLASNDSDLVIDINGYFAAPGSGGLSMYPAVPCRVLDTRKHNGGDNGEFIGTMVVDVVDSMCPTWNLAQAYVLNATVIPSAPFGYLTMWPDGGMRPLVSTLNAVDGAIASNMAIVPTNNGKVDAYASGFTQLILDISSFFAP